MTLARLLAVTLLVCALPALAQGQQSQDPRPSTSPRRPSCAFECAAPSSIPFRGLWFLDLPPAAPPAEPWRIIPNRPAGLGPGQIPPYRPGVEHIQHVTGKGYPVSNAHSCGQWSNADATCHMVRLYFMSMLPNGQPASMDVPVNESDVADTTCYAIRSYVVARDSKDSDSTHPVSYTTCQPSSRYGLKTTEIRTRTGDR